jgi:flagellar biosynthesis protein FliR
MLEVDNPPVVLFGIVLLALLAPVIYSFFVDKFDKDKKQVNDF